MKPLTLQLSLLLQNVKKTIDKDLYSEAARAQEISYRIFGLKIPFILDGEDNPKSNKSITSISTILGYHEWEYDIMRVFYKKIKLFTEKYQVDYRSVFQFCFCHEVGHAKQQRMFERIDYFPNKFRMLPEGVIVEIESVKYALTRFSISGKEFWDVFSCGILDFAINKEMSRNHMINNLTRPITLDTSAPPMQTEIPRNYLVLESLLLLPHNIDTYEHGGLLDDEKHQFMESKKKTVGDKWNSALTMLRNVEYSNPENTLNTIIKMFHNVLGITAFLGFPEDRKYLFRGYPEVPNYWDKDDYRVIFL